MNALLTGLTVAGVMTGLLITVLAFMPQPKRQARPDSQFFQRFSSLGTRATTRQKVLFGVGVIAGIISAALSGSLIAVVLVPAGFIIIPLLLSNPPNMANIKKLEAMEEWARSLGGLTQGGIDLERAIKFSVASSPDLLRPHLVLLVARLNSNLFSTDEALDRLADDLNDGTGDRLVANLKLTARIRTGNLSEALDALATGIAEEVTNRRKTEAERSGPRRVARIITVVASAVILLLFLNGSYMSSYSSFGGQLMLTVLIGAFFASLVWMRQIGIAKPPVRILKSPRRK